MDYDARSSKVRNPRGTFSWKGQLEKKREVGKNEKLESLKNLKLRWKV